MARHPASTVRRLFRRGWWVWLAALVGASLATSLGWSDLHAAAHPTPRAPEGAPLLVTPTTEAPTTTTSTLPPPVSVVARAHGPSVAVYDTPDSLTPSRTLANPQPDGGPLVFLVHGEQGDRLQVDLPVRPNGSTGWIDRDQVDLSQHNFHIVVEMSAHRITVYEGPDIFDQEPIGVGKATTPTPGGHYYTKELFRPPNPNGPYGPFAYGLSGFSNALPNFAGGEGVIGIHGTNQPALLGHDVSHGCIRMSNAGISKLAAILPLGVPVDIRS